MSGGIIRVMANSDHDLGQLLVQYGYLTPTRVAEAMGLRGSPPDKTLATVVVERGWIAPEALDSLSTATVVPTEKPAPPDSPVSRGSGERATLTFGRFRLLEKIGAGGFGTVHRAWDPAMEREVALKVLRLETSEARGRFLREVKASARLRHPNVVPVFEFGEEAGRPFLVMELVSGKSLKDLCREGPLPGRRAAEIVRDVARAVHYAHQEGVLHRDIKPENLLIDSLGRPRLLDFGLARLLESFGDKLTQTGSTLGTPSYMPPEQTGGGSADERSDVYSLGATLYHCLTGVAPFRGGSPTEVVYAVLLKAVVPPCQLEPTIPPGLEEICLRCMQKEKADRYSSAELLAEDLSRFLETAPTTPRSRRTRLGRLVLGAFALVGLGAGVAGVLGTQSSPSAPAPSAEVPPTLDTEPSLATSPGPRSDLPTEVSPNNGQGRFGSRSEAAKRAPVARLPESLDAGRVLHYRFSAPDEVRDESGRGNHGEQLFGATWNPREALSFDGLPGAGLAPDLAPAEEHDLVFVGATPTGFPLNGFTISVVCAAKNDGAIVGSGQAELWPREWFLSARRFRWTWRAGRAAGSKGSLAREVTFDATGQGRRHLTLIRSGETVRVYVDGQLAASADGFSTDPLPVYSYGLMVGNTQVDRGKWVRWRCFRGEVDEVVLWDRALKDFELKELFQARAVGSEGD